MKHFHKIATIKSDYACYGNQLKFHCPYPLKLRFVELSISRRQPKYYPLCQNLPFFPTYAAIDPKRAI